MKERIPPAAMKDRMALSMIEGAEKRESSTGRRVIEYTGGSTGSFWHGVRC